MKGKIILKKTATIELNEEETEWLERMITNPLQCIGNPMFSIIKEKIEDTNMRQKFLEILNG